MFVVSVMIPTISTIGEGSVNTRRIIAVLWAVTLLCMQGRAQTFSWQTLDGPYRPDTRVHLRYQDGDRRYIGSMGGTHRSTDGGTTWFSVGTLPAKPITVYPSMQGTVYAVADTGIGPMQPSSGLTQKMYRSMDRGVAWDSVYFGQVHAVAATGGDTVYLLAGRVTGYANSMNVLRSTDRGGTWTNVLGNAAAAWFNDMYVEGSAVYVAGYAPLAGDSIYRSTNAGATWQSIQAEMVTFHAPNKLLRLRHDQTMAGGTMQQLKKTHLELSTNNGSTWTETLSADSGIGSLINTVAGTVLVLREPNAQAYGSTDGGATWKAGASAAQGDPFVAMRFSGTQTVIGMTEGGSYYRTTDRGGVWSPVYDAGGSWLKGEMQAASDSLLVIADEKGNWIESTDAGLTWTVASDPLSMTPIAALACLPSGSVFAGDVAGLARLDRSGDWHRTWNPWQVNCMTYRSGSTFLIGTGSHGVKPLQYFGGIYAVDTAAAGNAYVWGYGGANNVVAPTGGSYTAVHAITESLIVAARGTILQRTTNRGSAWSTVGTSNLTYTTIVGDTADGVWAGTDTAGVFRSTDRGATWAASNSGLTNLHVLSLTVMSSGYILAGTRSGVFRSTDKGVTWTGLGLSGLTIRTVSSIGSTKILAGSSTGFQYSANNGANWTSFSDGLDDPDIHALAIAADGNVYCGTAAHGVYRMVQTPLPIPVPIGSVTAVRPVGRPVRLRWHPVQVDIPGAGYQVQISTSPIFTRISVWDTTFTHLSDTTVVIRWLAAGKTYYWRVRTAAYGNYSGFGPSLTFTTSATAIGHAVFLVSPADGSTALASLVPLRWMRPDSGAARYRVEYATDSTFAKAEVDSSVVDTSLALIHLGINKTIYWRVAASMGKGWGDPSETYSFVTRLTGVEAEDGLPTTYAMERNFPNLFNPATVIRWRVPEASRVRLVVYDLLGREVSVLLDERKDAGRFETRWDASHLATGMYILRMSAGSFTACQKMLLLR